MTSLFPSDWTGGKGFMAHKIGGGGSPLRKPATKTLNGGVWETLWENKNKMYKGKGQN